MNRLLAAVAPLFWILFCAQIPYEFFEIVEITPADVSSLQPVPEPNPTLNQLSLDNQTQIAGDLTLSEPFAPPVGIYKRNTVYSDIIYRDNTFFIVPDNRECHIVHPTPVIPRTHTLHRSALLFLTLTDAPAPLPADSPEMQITSLSARLLSPDTTTDPKITITQCHNNNYQIYTDVPGTYQIEYETVSPADAAVPQDAVFFESASQHTSQLFPNIQQIIHNIILSHPELSQINQSPTPLANLIRFFQSFTSDPLKADTKAGAAQSPLSLLEAILSEKKGLCRHRAILFTLIAQAWGYQVRIAVNEIHAFVEIRHMGRWYPIELGGMANSLTIRPTNPSLPATVQTNYSFASASSDAASTHTPIPPTDPYTVSDMSHPTQRPQAPTVRTPRTIQLEFIPDSPMPPRMLRNETISISGQMLTSLGIPYASQPITLEISNVYYKRIAHAHAYTDSNGRFSIKLKLPPNWPVGKTVLQWLPDK